MIHIVHTLGGCGGTLLSRCLGVLPGAAVLSEINPASVKLYPHFDPLYQDDHWLHLLETADRQRFSTMDLTVADNFRALIAVFHDRAKHAGRHLILRDFNYIDFIGVPFDQDPPRRLTIHDALPEGVPTASVAFVRHPLDQWLSLCKHEELRASLNPGIFCDAYAAFLQALGSVRVYRYEDFIKDPERELESMCSDLLLPFEPSFIERFHSFDSVTGDFTRLRDTSISPPPKGLIAPPALQEFRESGSFGKVLNAAGYLEQTADQAQANPVP